MVAPLTTLLATILALGTLTASTAEPQPNIQSIICDDLSAATYWLGPLGTVATRNLQYTVRSRDLRCVYGGTGEEELYHYRVEGAENVNLTVAPAHRLVCDRQRREFSLLVRLAPVFAKP